MPEEFTITIRVPREPNRGRLDQLVTLAVDVAAEFYGYADWNDDERADDARSRLVMIAIQGDPNIH